ncbi:MAG: hypothetical protein HC769_34825 [Cyanobacteria bacterium CRU_2_1]|nr:hypothetical protein [Cyanobacteria bacterium RU_5_0]NJR63502.1 hypothetical protein [Cyanobacteria bacterium CRU_2_1]
MTTVKFSATPDTLVETQGTVLTFRFELDQLPPPGGITITVKGNVPQSLTQLDLFALSATGGEQPVGDFDFSGFDFKITDRVATIRAPIFQDSQAEGLQTVIYTLQAGSGYTVDNSVRSATIRLADNPGQVPASNGKILGTARADTLTGTARKDTIDGAGGNDVISGLGNNDTLVGNNGNDILLSGAGSDALTGGKGRDTFGLEKGSGTDRILDFTDRQDRLGLTPGISFGQLRFTQQGDNLLIKAGNDALAILTDVQRNQISRADFTTLS